MGPVATESRVLIADWLLTDAVYVIRLMVVERPLPVHERMSAVNYILFFFVQGLQDVARQWFRIMQQIKGLGSKFEALGHSYLVKPSDFLIDFRGAWQSCATPTSKPVTGHRGRWGWSNAPWNYVGCRKIDMNSGSIDCESICFTLCTHIQIWNGHCGFYLGPVHSQTDQSSSIFCIQILEVTWLSTVWIKESRSLIFPIFGARIEVSKKNSQVISNWNSHALGKSKLKTPNASNFPWVIKFGAPDDQVKPLPGCEKHLWPLWMSTPVKLKPWFIRGNTSPRVISSDTFLCCPPN